MLSAEDIADFPSPTADAVVAYGDSDFQFGELRVPESPGPHPTIVLIHGGCWLAEYDIAHIRNLAAAFADNGIATWTLEYRRVGHHGGGWPGTFEDIAKGAAQVKHIAEKYDLNLQKLITAGHSAGGQLALWLASVPSDFCAHELIRPMGVLALAPAADLAFLHATKICDHVVHSLMGGSPEEHPMRYRATSPIERLPLGVPQHIVLGVQDETWTPVGQRYFNAARESADQIVKIDAQDSGHFEMIDPRTSTWPTVLRSARQLLELG